MMSIEHFSLRDTLIVGDSIPILRDSFSFLAIPWILCILFLFLVLLSAFLVAMFMIFNALYPQRQLVEFPYGIIRHLAIIMDGNRRYGRKRFGSVRMGHDAGGKKLVEVIKWCREAGVEFLTVYAFSTENWNRPKAEIDALMEIFKKYSKNLEQESLKEDIKVRVLASDPSKIPADLRLVFDRLERNTQNCTGIQLNLCVSYGARSELMGAVRSLVSKASRGELSSDKVTENMLESKLLTAGMPDPDLLLRTSESRLSNFLLWQVAYSELLFIPKTWPELSKKDFRRSFADYAKRKRRFGK